MSRNSTQNGHAHVAISRAQELKALGFRTCDALHLACAEQATVDIFLTTDDHVLRIATRHTAQLCKPHIGMEPTPSSVRSCFRAWRIPRVRHPLDREVA